MAEQHNEQNGPPLIRRQAQWEAAIALTLTALAAVKEETR